MSELPEGWKYSTLEELGLPKTITVDPRAFPNETFELYSVPSYYSGYPEIAKGGDIGSTKQLVQPGDVLLCKIVPHLVRVWVVPERKMHRQIASGEWILVRPSLCNTGYIRRLLMEPAFRDRFMETVSGVGGSLLRARPKAVSQIPIPIAPKNEQNRIALKLDSLFERTRRAREELSHISRLIENYKKAILEAAFRGELTTEWRESKGLATPEEVALGDVADGFSYGSSSKSSLTGKIPVLRMGNIQNMALDWNDLVYTSNDQEIAKYSLVSGDVLFNRTNSPELVGKTALYRGERPAIYAGYLIRIRCGTRLLPEYLNYCLNSPMGRTYCWRVKSDGVSQSNINAKKLAAFPLLLPVIEDQREIVRRIEKALDWLKIVEAEQGQATHLLGRLDQANLAKAFRGELVPQDPNDEPASVLLDRIRGEQAGEARIRRGRRRRAGTEQEAMA